MKKIDRETVQRILDTADIVDVVSDFVSLKKRGTSYLGLCPFHNERTPSFSVSKAKNICKCFSCGKGGSPLNFIMEHEQLSYYEALKYLAKKYNIEIKEHELTDEERQQATEREALMAVNDFALAYFEKNLTDTPDGRDIGYAYFRERGINDQMIKKFHLGYALDKSDALYNAAIAKGFSEKYLIATGLCARSEKGWIYDRFKGRVIYPVFSVSGRVIAFGGRTLRSDKSMAKYVNSPESLIYRKSYELYGLYQAKSSIVKHDKCILVEGYMDVISMHQVGIENVVASSGTSLTDGQIRLIHRFTKNVTVIYDADPAGIKASLRGIDMLLAEGMDIKVLSLPQGEDPDSFAQSHSCAEVEEYIANNEKDFIRFKTDILLADAGSDPVKRANVIADIVRSISVIPEQITRAVYIKECSRMLDISEKVLSLELSKRIAENVEKKWRPSADQRGTQDQGDNAAKNQPTTDTGGQAATSQSPIYIGKQSKTATDRLRQSETALMKYVVRYGLLPIADDIDNPDAEVTVIDYIDSELRNDDILLTDPVCNRLLADALEIAHKQWPSEKQAMLAQLQRDKDAALHQGHEEIRLKARDMAEIETMELRLNEHCAQVMADGIKQKTGKYLADVLLSMPDDAERALATSLASEKYKLSKVHTKYAQIATEEDNLAELVERAVWELKFTILDLQIVELNEEMKQANADPARSQALMTQLFQLYQLKSQFAKYLGERIVNPK